MRLVEWPTPELNALYDTLPLRGKIAIMCQRFDEWVRGNGSNKCIGCDAVVKEIGGNCGQCWFTSGESEG
jgi:hypothetical protein